MIRLRHYTLGRFDVVVELYYSAELIGGMLGRFDVVVCVFSGINQ